MKCCCFDLSFLADGIKPQTGELPEALNGLHITTPMIMFFFNQTILGLHLNAILQWDLVCNQRFLASATQSVFVAGLMVGVLLSGGLADRWAPSLVDAPHPTPLQG